MIDKNNEYNVADKQYTLLSMMTDFHEFCVNRGINYSIIGGTLLGAIREGGFIPWDDDVDIIMDRKNFELLKSASEEMGKYCLCEPLWVYKVVDKNIFETEGVSDDTPVLDIFIADRVPAGAINRKIKILSLKFLQGMMKTKVNEKKDFSLAYKAALLITGLTGKLFSETKKQHFYETVSKWGSKNADQPLMICNDIFQSLGCQYDSKLMDEYSLIDFENTKLMAIKNWDNYLTEQYGDYMTPVRTEH